MKKDIQNNKKDYLIGWVLIIVSILLAILLVRLGVYEYMLNLHYFNDFMNGFFEVILAAFPFIVFGIGLIFILSKKRKGNGKG